MKRREIDLRYCNGCAVTTKHTATELTYCCLRCGTVKYVKTPVVKPAPAPRP